MKIILVQPRVSYYVGGGEKLLLNHAEYLAGLGNKIVILTTLMPANLQSFLFRNFKHKNPQSVSIKEIGIPEKFKYIYKKKPGMSRDRWDAESILFGKLIHGHLRELKPDIIINYYLLDGISNPIGVPNVLYLIGYPSDNLTIRRSFLRFYDSIICISSIVKAKWRTQIESPKNLFVLNSGVDIRKDIKFIDLKYKYNIVFAGRLIERKGVTTLISALRRVVKELPGTHLWILGDGPEKNKIRLQIGHLKLKESVSLLGLTENVFDYFNSADIAVFPSYGKEGLMGAVLEAMAVGKPVVTTTGNGNEDVIQNGRSGILIKPRRTKELSAAIIYLLENKSKRKQIGKNAVKVIAKNYTWDKKIKEFHALLGKIIKK